jgi:hypothetical protein
MVNSVVSGEVSSIQRYNGEFRRTLKTYRNHSENALYVCLLSIFWCVSKSVQLKSLIENAFLYVFETIEFRNPTKKALQCLVNAIHFFRKFLRSLIFKFGHKLVSGTFQINSGNDVSKTGSVLTQHNNVGQR